MLTDTPRTAILGHAYKPQFAIAIQKGTKSPDVAWMSNARWRNMQEIADPTTIAPEVCVEVMCPTNTEDEMRDKIELYLETGTEEVWIVGEEGGIQFFGEEDQMEQSRMVPDGPASV